MKHLWLPALFLWMIALSCATQTTPQGGPKDSIPPSVIRYNPKPNEVNFNKDEIVITFSEPVQLNNPKEEIIIVPTLGQKTEYKLRGNALVITPELPWKENTTYNLNLREAIKDITENNPAIDPETGKGLPVHLAFSTGPTIDSLTISGTIREALTDLVPENITVALYTTDTFNIFEDIPEYFTKSDKEGNFLITNLKQGKYRIYAFQDKNKNLKAETRTEKFGFLASTIQLDSNISKLRILLVNIDSRKPKLTTNRNQSNVNIIRFNKSMSSYKIVADTQILSTFNTTQTEILAYYEKKGIDSALVQIKATDSINQKVDTLIYIKRDKRPKIKETFRVSASDLVYNIDNNQLDFKITLNKPIKKLNPDSLYVQYDSLTRLPVRLTKYKLDTAFNQILVSEPVPIDSLPKNPKLTFAPSFLISIDDDSSKNAAATLKLIDTPTTATLKLELQTTQPHFILQVLSASNKVIREYVDQKKLKINYLPPETVRLRVIIDTNANGKWDTANYPENLEPEKVIYYLNPDKKPEVPLRANWEVGPLRITF